MGDVKMAYSTYVKTVGDIAKSNAAAERQRELESHLCLSHTLSSGSFQF